MNRSRRAFLGIAGFGALASGAAALARTIRLELDPANASRLGATAVPVAARWAMAVDLSKCLRAEGCRDCIQACHRTHNVPAIPDARHEVKWLWKARFEKVFPGETISEGIRGQGSGIGSSRISRRDGPTPDPRPLAPDTRDDPTPGPRPLAPDAPVLVLCNHCDNPPCVRVCPAKATWKRDDGIVMMDQHRCIGCRYCMAACPYGARSFNWENPRPHLAALDTTYPTRTKGVVEKCTFCEERLAAGRPPACVEACREKAVVFGDVNDPASDVRELLRRRYSIRRRPGLGTRPQVYYLVG